MQIREICTQHAKPQRSSGLVQTLPFICLMRVSEIIPGKQDTSNLLIRAGKQAQRSSSAFFTLSSWNRLTLRLDIQMHENITTNVTSTPSSELRKRRKRQKGNKVGQDNLGACLLELGYLFLVFRGQCEFLCFSPLSPPFLSPLSTHPFFLKLCLTSPDFLFSSFDSPVCFLLLPSSCLSFSLLSRVFLTLFPISSPDLLNFLTPLLFCSFTHSSFPAIFLPFAFIIPLLVFPSLYSLLVFLSPSFFILLLPFLLNCSFLTSLFVTPFLILCFFISPCLSSPAPTHFHLRFLSSFVPYHPPSSLPSSCLFFNFFILYPLF